MLYAGLAAGINLPYECGSGTCGTCRARLITGEIDDRWPEAAGRKFLKRASEFLMCQCVARNDCTVEVASFVYNMDPGACFPAFRAGTIRQTKALTRDVIAFSVELARTDGFRCRAVRDDAGARRSRLSRLLDGQFRASTQRDSISSSRRSPAAARRNGCSRAAADGARRRVVRAARRGDVLPQSGQERPVHRRRQRDRRHDVDPRARTAGALFRSIQRLRVLRRAHLRRCVLSRRTVASLRASSQTDCT